MFYLSRYHCQRFIPASPASRPVASVVFRFASLLFQLQTLVGITRFVFGRVPFYYTIDCRQSERQPRQHYHSQQEWEIQRLLAHGVCDVIDRKRKSSLSSVNTGSCNDKLNMAFMNNNVDILPTDTMFIATPQIAKKKKKKKTLIKDHCVKCNTVKYLHICSIFPISIMVI